MNLFLSNIKKRKFTKNKVLKLFVIFFAIMIGMTIISRITYNFIVPKVLMGQVEENVIKHSIDAQGEIKGKSETPVITKENLIVSSVHVVEGQRVNEGDILYTIESSSLDEIIVNEQEKVTAMQKQINELENGEMLSSEVYSLKADYRELKRDLQEYKTIKNKGYAVRATCSGMITEIIAKAGDKTSGSADIIISEPNKNLIVTVSLNNEENTQFIDESTKATIRAASVEEIPDLPISVISDRSEESMITVSVNLPDDQFVIGQNIDITLESSSRRYENCIPRSALHLDSDTYFVYGIKKENTILGEEFKTVKYEVKVLDKNEEFVAVEGVSTGQQIIFESDRPVEEGTKVRKGL